MSDSEAGGDGPKKGRGRPKKASEPRSESKDSGDEPKAKRGRGRPKGSVKKGKKVAASNSVASPKKGRGKPKKSAPKETKNLSDDGGSDASDADD
ncbi:high mobility group protein HMG-I/HMG-Y-like [Uloborus diversus]|uniref:high mobility group protein HMG-I/HMG-Y-like n=1 Tax=Uloborus diversus TaxID=327109 RepID=UPI002409EF78|nr:high mobility group protein HMG-I/HMG-Y-like [Uloborus diversus]